MYIYISLYYQTVRTAIYYKILEYYSGWYVLFVGLRIVMAGLMRNVRMSNAHRYDNNPKSKFKALVCERD